jgi:hypothetical protein
MKKTGIISLLLLTSTWITAQTLTPAQWENAKQNGALNGKQQMAVGDSSANGGPYMEYRGASCHQWLCMLAGQGHFMASYPLPVLHST